MKSELNNEQYLAIRYYGSVKTSQRILHQRFTHQLEDIILNMSDLVCRVTDQIVATKQSIRN